jgi:hypothetical protein
VLIYRLAAGYPLYHHNTLEIKENHEHGIEIWTTYSCFFFGLGDNADFHYIDYRLVFISYVNTQVLSQVIIALNKSGPLSMCSKSANTSPCDVRFVHLTAVLKPFLHKTFSRSIPPLEFAEHFPCQN